MKGRTRFYLPDELFVNGPQKRFENIMFPFLRSPVTPHRGYDSQIVANDIDISVIDQHPFILPNWVIIQYGRKFQRRPIQ